jgi:hypothetical protein
MTASIGRSSDAASIRLGSAANKGTIETDVADDCRASVDGGDRLEVVLANLR